MHVVCYVFMYCLVDVVVSVCRYFVRVLFLQVCIYFVVASLLYLCVRYSVRYVFLPLCSSLGSSLFMYFFLPCFVCVVRVLSSFAMAHAVIPVFVYVVRSFPPCLYFVSSFFRTGVMSLVSSFVRYVVMCSFRYVCLYVCVCFVR